MKHELPKLNYGYDALEPWIDAKTMEIHWSKHHETYVNKLNESLAGYSNLQDRSARSLIADLASMPEAVRGAIRNFGGGHFNHSFFWTVIGREGRGEPRGALAEAIAKDFGGYQAFREAFTKVANGGFGSGWAWLVRDREGKLKITWTANQESPVSEGFEPIVTLDVWEHAYYLKFQNRRPEYTESWWNVVDWNAAEERFSGRGFEV